MRKAIAIEITGYMEDLDTIRRWIKKWIVIPTIIGCYIEEGYLVSTPYLLVIDHHEGAKTVVIYSFKRDAEKVMDEIILALEEYYND